MKLAATALALAVLPALPACTGDDDGDPDPAPTWRLPCASTLTWTPASDGGVETRVYRYDGRHLLESTTTNQRGDVIYHATRGWVGERVAWVDVVSTTNDYRSDYTYDQAGRYLRVERDDRRLDNGDQGAITDYTYDARGALIAVAYDYRDPQMIDRRSTITGNLTPREEWVDCDVTGEVPCDRYVYEQADRNPEHWTVGTADYGSDGVIDFRWTRRMDRHGLETYFDETDFSVDPSGALTLRYTTTRDADGTELDTSGEFFDGGPTPYVTYLEHNLFTCGARVAPAGVATRVAPGRAAFLDGRGSHLPDARRAVR